MLVKFGFRWLSHEISIPDLILISVDRREVGENSP